MRHSARLPRRLPKEDEAGPEAIVCRLCGRAFRKVSFTHLRRKHGWKGEHPVERYKHQFGLPVACCRATRRILRRLREQYWTSRGRHWPRERVLAELRRREREGLSLAAKRVEISLLCAAQRRFGTWRRALHRAGVTPQPPRRRPHRWDRARLTEAIRFLDAVGEPLYATRIEKEHPDLYRAAHAVAGCWRRALLAAGLRPEAHRKPSKWSLVRAREWVRTRRAAGQAITFGAVPPGLLTRVRHDTKMGWATFVESLGLRYPGLRKRLDWTREAVVAAIRERRRKGLALNREAVSADGQGVIHQARKYFGSWDGALRAAGIAPERVRRKRTWAREDVISAIRARRAAGRPMRHADAYAEEPRLVKAAQRVFSGGWARALAAAGLDPSLARRPIAKARSARRGRR